MFFWYAPDGVTALLLELPVAEGTDDIVILQAFRLVDGEDADTVSLVALYGLAAETVIPLSEEGVDVGSILTDIFGELVVEGEDIGTLVVALFELEDGMQPFCEFIDGHLEQFCRVFTIVFGQQCVEVIVCMQQFVVCRLLFQHIGMIEFHEGRLCQQVVRVGEQPERLYQQVHGT